MPSFAKSIRRFRVYCSIKNSRELRKLSRQRAATQHHVMFISRKAKQVAPLSLSLSFSFTYLSNFICFAIANWFKENCHTHFDLIDFIVLCSAIECPKISKHKKVLEPFKPFVCLLSVARAQLNRGQTYRRLLRIRLLSICGYKLKFKEIDSF